MATVLTGKSIRNAKPGPKPDEEVKVITAGICRYIGNKMDSKR